MFHLIRILATELISSRSFIQKPLFPSLEQILDKENYVHGILVLQSTYCGKYVTAVSSGPFLFSHQVITGAYDPDEIPVMYFMFWPGQGKVRFICSFSRGSQFQVGEINDLVVYNLLWKKMSAIFIFIFIYIHIIFIFFVLGMLQHRTTKRR